MFRQIPTNPLKHHPIFWHSGMIDNLRVQVNNNAEFRLITTVDPKYHNWTISQVAQDLQSLFGEDIYTGPHGLVERRREFPGYENLKPLPGAKVICHTWLCLLNHDEDEKQVDEPAGWPCSIKIKAPCVRESLRFRTKTLHMKLFCTRAYWGWPDPSEYPLGYPIASFLDLSEEDPYIPGPTCSGEYNEFYQKERSEASKHAEEVAILIAMAQKQEEAVTKTRFMPWLHDDPRLNIFRPCIAVADNEDSIRLTRATITLDYLKKLENAENVPGDLGEASMEIHHSQRLYFRSDEHMKCLALLLAGVFKEYKTEMEPIFEDRLPYGTFESSSSTSVVHHSPQYVDTSLVEVLD